MSKLYKKILIATDGSEYVKKAVTHAIELAKLSDAELHAVYVMDIKASRGPKPYPYTDISAGGMKRILRKEGLSTDLSTEGQKMILRREGVI